MQELSELPALYFAGVFVDDQLCRLHGRFFTTSTPHCACGGSPHKRSKPTAANQYLAVQQPPR
jgi:hypothetical protein